MGRGAHWPGHENSNLPLAGSSGGGVTPPPAALGGVYGVGLRISVISCLFRVLWLLCSQRFCC
jgi:hypothetical protein